MAKQITIRNISNRPLHLNFEKESIILFPKKVSKPILQSAFEEDKVAKTQLQKYIKDKEVKVTTTETKTTKKQ